ncbi:UNVERIFIED_CONTAM: hypothetical protein NCL1_44812 [Trichonephila clavipes]
MWLVYGEDYSFIFIRAFDLGLQSNICMPNTSTENASLWPSTVDNLVSTESVKDHIQAVLSKEKGEEVESTITCNDEPLIREKSGDYVYDVYISDVQIDCSFVDNPVSVRPCTMAQDDIYSGESDDEVHEDEDDSNDENNWRNEYPEDESSDSHSEDGSRDYESEEYDPYECDGVGNMSIGNGDEEICEYDSEEDDIDDKAMALMECMHLNHDCT